MEGAGDQQEVENQSRGASKRSCLPVGIEEEGGRFEQVKLAAQSDWRLELCRQKEQDEARVRE